MIVLDSFSHGGYSRFAFIEIETYSGLPSQSTSSAIPLFVDLKNAYLSPCNAIQNIPEQGTHFTAKEM